MLLEGGTRLLWILLVNDAQWRSPTFAEANCAIVIPLLNARAAHCPRGSPNDPEKMASLLKLGQATEPPVGVGLRPHDQGTLIG